MKQTKVSLIAVVFGAFFWLLPSVGETATKTVNCNVPGKTLQGAIDKAKAGDTFQVINGSTCIENVVVNVSHERITIDGLGSATINGPDATSPTINVGGRRITIKGFTITGGQEGIHTIRGGNAIIDGNTIQNTGRSGIGIHNQSSAIIVNNTIQNNPDDGINVIGGSNAFIGVRSGSDTEASPNTIQNNGRHGVLVTRSSNARVVGNTIKDNTENGVFVDRVSQADISKNVIDNNSGDGITVGRNSGVNLGSDLGDGIFDAPNDTTVGQENTGNGIRCFLNSYADGRLGTLKGIDGPKDGFGVGGCRDSLI